MKNLALILTSLLLVTNSLNCHATDEWMKSNADWAKSIIPEQLTVSLNKTKTEFKGFKQQKIELIAVQNIKNNLTLETELLMYRSRVNETVISQKSRDFSASVMPRYQVTHNLSVGFGVKYESAPVVELPGNERYTLGAARSLVVSGKIKGLNKNQWVQVDLANYKRDGFDIPGTYASTIDGFTENTVSVKYQGRF